MTSDRIDRNGNLRWVAVADVHVSTVAQRPLRPGKAAKIAAEFDPDRFGTPILSYRDGKYYAIDGQHRFEALQLMGWNDQQVQCWVHTDLTEAEEADMFLWHNDSLAVSALDKFKVGIVAQRPEECDIDRIVRLRGYSVGHHSPDSINAVSSLRAVYHHGPTVLARTLSLVDRAYGPDGMRADIIKGVGLLCARYNGLINDDQAVEKLGKARGGLGALTTKAHSLRKQLGAPMAQCVAGAATELLNTGKGGKKLPNWWS